MSLFPRTRKSRPAQPELPEQKDSRMPDQPVAPPLDTSPSMGDLDHFFDPEVAPADAAPEPRVAIMVGSNDIAALYVDGTLAFGGDHYAVYLRALEEAGIELMESDSFLLGNSSTPESIAFDAAPTLALAREYDYKTKQAAMLREQAETLLTKAAELEEHLRQNIETSLMAAPVSDEPRVETETDDD